MHKAGIFVAGARAKDAAGVTPPIVMFIERLFHWGQEMPLTTKSAA
jgi:hypothetical protein